MFTPFHGAGSNGNGAGKLALPLSKPAKKLQDQAEKVSRMLAFHQRLSEFSQLLHHLSALSGSSNDGLPKMKLSAHTSCCSLCAHYNVVWAGGSL